MARRVAGGRCWRRCAAPVPEVTREAAWGSTGRRRSDHVRVPPPAGGPRGVTGPHPRLASCRICPIRMPSGLVISHYFWATSAWRICTNNIRGCPSLRRCCAGEGLRGRRWLARLFGSPYLWGIMVCGPAIRVSRIMPVQQAGKSGIWRQQYTDCGGEAASDCKKRLVAEWGLLNSQHGVVVRNLARTSELPLCEAFWTWALAGLAGADGTDENGRWGLHPFVPHSAYLWSVHPTFHGGFAFHLNSPVAHSAFVVTIQEFDKRLLGRCGHAEGCWLSLAPLPPD